MESDNRNEIFQADYKILDAAYVVLQNMDNSNLPIKTQFEELYLGYKKLLRQSIQLINIADRQQDRLYNLQIDITEKNRELEALCITDGLTGIANRRCFDEILVQEYARHARTGAELSVIMLDVDYFKAFNDNYGHINGDECLRQVAAVIKSCTCRPADLVARYGGEEFACILPETNQGGAVAIGDNIRSSIMALAIPHAGSSVANQVTASLGVVTVNCISDGSAVDVVAKADELLYQAKLKGRNRLEFEKGSE